MNKHKGHNQLKHARILLGGLRQFLGRSSCCDSSQSIEAGTAGTSAMIRRCRYVYSLYKGIIRTQQMLKTHNPLTFRADRWTGSRVNHVRYSRFRRLFLLARRSSGTGRLGGTVQYSYVGISLYDDRHTPSGISLSGRHLALIRRRRDVQEMKRNLHSFIPNIGPVLPRLGPTPRK